MLPLLFFVFAYFAVAVGTTIGFGASTIFLPLALFFVDFKIALILSALLHIFYTVGRIAFFWKHIDKKLAVLFGIPNVIFAIVGAFFVNYAPQEILKFALGAMLISYSITAYRKPEWKLKTTKSNVTASACLSGFLTGLIGTGGAVRAAMFSSFNLKKMPFIATSAVIALFVDLARIPVYLSSGFLSSAFYNDVIGLLVVSMLGAYTGKAFVEKINQDTFKQIVLVGIGLLSLKLMIEAFL